MQKKEIKHARKEKSCAKIALTIGLQIRSFHAVNIPRIRVELVLTMSDLHHLRVTSSL